MKGKLGEKLDKYTLAQKEVKIMTSRSCDKLEKFDNLQRVKIIGLEKKNVYKYYI